MPRFLTADRLLGTTLLAACALLWFIIVPEYVKGQEQSLFPRVAIVWIALCATAITLLPPIRTPRGGSGPDDAGVGIEPLHAGAVETDNVTVVTLDEPLPSVLVVTIIWGLYAAAVGVLGFYLATWLMLVASMAYLGIRRPRALIVRPLLALVIVHVLLERLLRFRLPEAFWQ